MPNKKTRPGGRVFYGWVIIAISFVVLAMGTVTRISFPLFYVPLLDEFGWSRAGTATIVSVSGIIYGISAPIAGTLFDRFGPRKTFPVAALLIGIGALGTSQAQEIWQFYLFFGVIVALGLALIGFSPIVALASNWFVKWRATAVGLSTAGIQGAILLAPLVQLLISNLGWRNAFLVLAGIVPASIVPLSQLLRNRPQDMRLTLDGLDGDQDKEATALNREDSLIVDKEWASTDWTLSRALRTYRFWAIFGIMLGLSTAFNILFTHQVAFMVDIGFTATFAASLFVIFAVMSMIGRFGGLLSDRLGRELTYTIGSLGIVLSILMLILAKDTSDAWMLYVYVICFGLFAGSNAPTYAAATADLFHGRHFGSILGSADTGWGIGATLGPWLGGYIFDTTGSYTTAFIAAIIAISFAGASFWVASPGRVRRVAGRVR
ncbi:MAG: MFS transporter [Chloroflexi bacterium]|nr:MFS transporter [Chloroflexota bacterium]